MKKKGHEILFTTRDKDVAINLLKVYNFDYKNLGKPYKGLIDKMFGMIIFDMKLFKVAMKFRPDLFLSHGSMYAAQVSWLMNKRHYTFEDSECKEQILLFKPFSKLILTPDAITYKYGRNNLRFNGFLQSAYLHNNYYNPGNEIFKYLGLKKNERYFLLRFVGLEATHDRKLQALETDKKIKIIDLLERYGKVFISSEKELPPSLKKYQLKIPPVLMHDLIYYSSMLIGDSGAMTNEAALLGVPNILIENTELAVNRKFRELGLKFLFNSFSDKLLLKLFGEIAEDRHIKDELRKKAEDYFNNSVNLTEFIVWLAENHTNTKKLTYITNSRWACYVQ